MSQRSRLGRIRTFPAAGRLSTAGVSGIGLSVFTFFLRQGVQSSWSQWNWLGRIRAFPAAGSSEQLEPTESAWAYSHFSCDREFRAAGVSRIHLGVFAFFLRQGVQNSWSQRNRPGRIRTFPAAGSSEQLESVESAWAYWRFSCGRGIKSSLSQQNPPGHIHAFPALPGETPVESGQRRECR